MAERGLEVDHATLNRWVIKFSPLIAIKAHKRKRGKSRRAAEYEYPADFERLVLVDRNPLERNRF